METWLQYATNPVSEMAYFMWDDDGSADLIHRLEPDLAMYYDILPKPVTKTDVFRVVVCNTIGGVYADIDTKLLRTPLTWIDSNDISSWTDPKTGTIYGGSSEPINVILGIEADTNEDSTDYWRMGYTYPVQLTQWALAGAPGHKILTAFVEHFKDRVRDAIKQVAPNSIGDKKELEQAVTDPSTRGRIQQVLRTFDPLDFTGPASITYSTMTYLKNEIDFRWQALSGLEDGGRSKMVRDILILPITGFSPGRAKYGNMGSKPIDHPDARLQHLAQGSWRKFDLTVEMGKLCRTVLGQCRDWSKVPSS